MSARAGLSVELRDVAFSYGGVAALSNISFDVHEGEYLGIIGPNGGGKTTLLKIMLGLIKPDTGAVRLLGQASADFKERYRIGYVPQGSLNETFPASVEEIVWSGRTPRMGFFSRRQAEDREAVARAMEASGVWDVRGRLIRELSGGQRQRVSIARALASEPEILILDEPSTGIDMAAQETFYGFLAKLNRDLGMTIIFVSHDVGVVAREVGTLLCLNQHMVCHGRPESLVNDNFLEMVYGSHMKSVYHKHEHKHGPGVDDAS